METQGIPWTDEIFCSKFPDRSEYNQSIIIEIFYPV